MARNPQFENSNDEGGCCGNFGCLFLGLIPVASGIYVATRLTAYDDGALLEVGSDTATAAPVAWGAVATVVIVAFIICAIFGRQKWFAARLSGNMYREASADDESVNEVRWKLKKKDGTLPGMLGHWDSHCFCHPRRHSMVGSICYAARNSRYFPIGGLIYYLTGSMGH